MKSAILQTLEPFSRKLVKCFDTDKWPAKNVIIKLKKNRQIRRIITKALQDIVQTLL